MTSGRTLITAYNVLAIVGIASLSLIVCVSWLSPKVSRSSTWFSFMISSAVSSAIGILIIGQQEGEEPDRALCITQGILVNGIKVINAFGAAGLLLHVFLEMMLFDREGKREVLSPRQVIMINVVPFVISLAVLIPGIVLGIRNPSLFQRDPSGMRCHIVPALVSNLSIGLMASAVLMMLIFGIFCAKKLRRSWRTYSLSQRDTAPYRLVIRILVFVIIATMALGIAFISFAVNKTVWFPYPLYNFTIVGLPILVAIWFGSQSDIVEAFIFWKRYPVLNQEDSLA